MTLRVTHDTGLFGGIETDTLRVAGASILPFMTGKSFFCDPANGSDLLSGRTLAQAKKTLGAAYALMTAGNNDVLRLVGNGQASGSARLSANFPWNKNATHLVGIAAPTMVSQRARIAPTAAVAGFANFVTVSVGGCIFVNVSLFNGFDTGVANQICWTDTGERNYYENMHFGGMGDAVSAADAGSRSLKIGGGGNGEHTFVGCTIGLDTVSRGAANASLELVGATPRNTFIDCVFPFMTSAATPLGIICALAGAIDRWNLFKGCEFLNARGSGTTTMTALATLAASAGGFLKFSGCSRDDITDWGTDATSLAQIFVDGPATGATDDIGRSAAAIAT